MGGPKKDLLGFLHPCVVLVKETVLFYLLGCFWSALSEWVIAVVLVFVQWYRKPSVTESRQVCIELSAFLEKRVYVILVQHASRPSPTPSADVIEEQFLKAYRFYRFWSNGRLT